VWIRRTHAHVLANAITGDRLALNDQLFADMNGRPACAVEIVHLPKPDLRPAQIAKYRDRKKAEDLKKRHPDAVRIVDDETILFVGKPVIEVLKPPTAAPAPRKK
jgi:hypothetical protein